MKYIILIFAFLFCLPHNLCESFIVESPISSKEAINPKERKTSEIQEDLICLQEECLRLSTCVLEEIARLQRNTINELRKVAENTPRMPRVRLEKECKRVEKLCESLKSIKFDKNVF